MILMVALGGSAGTLVRWWLSVRFPQATAAIPWTTLAINVGGSFVLGFVARSTATTALAPAAATALTVGVCGGFTTFSTFSGEVWSQIQRGAWVRASSYAVISVVLCVVAVAAGDAIARSLRGD